MKKLKRIVVANWKMNPSTLSEAARLFGKVKSTAGRFSNVETVVCPPFVYLWELSRTYSGNKILFGAQNVFWESGGARTGEISPRMLKSLKARYVIIGHSERRALGEDNEEINKKVRESFREELSVILCIGERERDTEARYLAFLKEELESALNGISKKQLDRVIVAYEPIWAIGKTAKDAMQPADVFEMVLFIKKVLAEKYDKPSALRVPILYGGSVEPTNVLAILKDGSVDGFLVGHASLSAESFGEILRTVHNA